MSRMSAASWMAVPLLLSSLLASTFRGVADACSPAYTDTGVYLNYPSLANTPATNSFDVYSIFFDPGNNTAYAVTKIQVATFDYTATGSGTDLNTVIAGQSAVSQATNLGSWNGDQATGTDARFYIGHSIFNLVSREIISHTQDHTGGAAHLIFKLSLDAPYPVTRIIGQVGAPGCTEGFGLGAASVTAYKPGMAWTDEEMSSGLSAVNNCHRVAQFGVVAPYQLNWKVGDGLDARQDGYGIAAKLSSPSRLVKFRNRFYLASGAGGGTWVVGVLIPSMDWNYRTINTQGATQSGPLATARFYWMEISPAQLQAWDNCWIYTGSYTGTTTADEFIWNPDDGVVYAIAGLSGTQFAWSIEDPNGNYWKGRFGLANRLQKLTLAYTGCPSLPSCRATGSQSASPSGTSTITPPPTGTQTETITTAPTHSGTATFSHHHVSVTIHANSSTRSLSPTRTKTLTNSESPTLTLPPTGTETDTQSMTATVTPTHTTTLSISESFSEEVYCGDLKTEQCSVFLSNNYCNTTEDGSCFSQHCSSFSGHRGMCMRMGCAVNASSASAVSQCMAPPECRKVYDVAECQQLLTCRWLQDQGKCVLDTIRCDLQPTATDCGTVGCTWNDRGVPHKCFKPILAPALCRLVTDLFICAQQNCIWMEESSYCEAWDVTCDTLVPSPANCPFLPLCAHEASNNTCIDYTGVDFAQLPVTTIVSATMPSAVFPDESFKVELLGSVLKIGTHILTLVSSTATSCASPSSFISGTSTREIKSYDTTRQTNIVTVTIAAVGEYQFCVTDTEGPSLGPFGSVSVGTWTAQVSSCSTYPTSPFAATAFEISTKGKFLDPQYAVYTLVNSSLSAPNETECPATSSTTDYASVSRVDAQGIVHSKTSSLEGKYTLCYANRGGVPAVCPTYTSVQGVAPWLDMAIVEQVAAESLPTVGGLTITAFNRQYCKSMTAGNETDGVFTHPDRWSFKIGDGVVPYAGNEMCIFAALPQYVNGYVTPVDKVLITDLIYASLNLGDSVRVFAAATSAGSPVSCSSLDSYENCLKAACSWNAGSKTCSVGSENVKDCPSFIPGYYLRRSVTYDRFFDAGEELELGSATKGGLIFVACLNQKNVDGLGVSLKYRVQETYCPNDCKDKSGNRNGVCIREGSWKCKCNSGFAAIDCSRLAVCRGTGPLADTITGASGTETLDFQGGACGLSVVVDPTDSTIPRMEKFGVGLKIDNVNTKSIATDCATTYLSVRQGDYKGDILTTLCPADLQSTSSEKLRMLVSDATSLYFEYAGAPGDTFELSFTAVSLVCPGQADASGIPTPVDECDGRGSCTSIAYPSQQGKLGVAAFGCSCVVPWAASRAGETCDTCAFGHMVDTFPTCLPATICGNNCSNLGECVPGVGCRCNSGLYGLDCQLTDDGERNGDFLPIETLTQRLPLNGEDVGNVVTSGSIDRTLTRCSLPGSTTRCRSVTRSRGRKSLQLANSNSDSTLGFNGRRQTGSGSNKTTTSTNTSTDSGLTLNALSSKGNYPDFVRTDNVTGSDLDVSGSFTVLAWVNLTAKSNGFVFAKVDSAFLTDGSSPALNRALQDVLDRDTAETELHAYSALDSLSTHFALYIDGANKMVSLLATKPSLRKVIQDEGKERWHYVRHFRLGDKAGDLFDGSWRWLALRIYERNSQFEGQVFVDGFSRIADPDFVQCLPWLPQEIHHTNHSSGPNISSFGLNQDGASTIWGYHLKAGLDELTVYNYALNPATIPKLAGLTQLSEVTEAIITFLLVSSGLCLAFHGVMIGYYVGSAGKTEEKEKAEAAAAATTEAEEEKKGEANPDAISNDIVVPTKQSTTVQIAAAGDATAEENDGDDDDASVASVSSDGTNGGKEGDAAGGEHQLEGRAYSQAQLKRIVKYYSGINKFKHIQLLHEIEELRRREALKKLTGESKALKGNGTNDSTAAQRSTLTGSDLGAMGSVSVSSWQVLSQLASGMELPAEWVSIWGTFVHFFNFDLAVAFGTLYAAIFLLTVALTFIMFVVILLIQVTTKLRSKRELQKELGAIAKERARCLEENEEYKSVSATLKFKLALGFGTLLSIFYIPLVNQSLSVVFCHPNLMCIYDCYNDTTHQTLVIVGVVVLVVIGLGTPALFFVIIQNVVTQYHTYIGVFKSDVQEKNWPTFVDSVENPFGSFFANLHHGPRFFNPIRLVFSVLISASIVGLPAEGAAQIICCMILQLVYAGGTLYARSFRRDLVNIVVCVSQVFVVLIMMLRAVQLLDPEQSGPGIAMVVISFIAIVFQVVLVTMALKTMLGNFLEGRKGKKKRKEMKQAAEEDEEEKNNTALAVGGGRKNTHKESEMLQCPICCEKYNDSKHKPCLCRECGNSMCRACITSLKDCPYCRQDFGNPATKEDQDGNVVAGGGAAPVTNVALLEVVEEEAQRQRDEEEKNGVGAPDEQVPTVKSVPK